MTTDIHICMKSHILMLTRHHSVAASCRYRALQYIPYLEARGWSVEHWPLLGETYTKRILIEGRRSLWEAGRNYVTQAARLARTNASKFDVIFVQAEVFPWVPFFVERALVFDRHPAVVVDYDDAIYAHYSRAGVSSILGTKIQAVMHSCREVIVGNQTLYRYAAPFNACVTQIPTVVDLAGYTPKVDYSVGPGRPFVIGWIGTAATTKHLRSCQEALSAVAREHRFVLRCIGAPSDFCLPGVDVERLPWTAQTELDVIKSFDIAIMPLTDDAFARGKCGFKLVQYMASAIPAIGERVGANAEIITDGANGLLASSTEEYVQKIGLLIHDRILREALGRAGRARVESEYCTRKTAPQLEGVLLRACGREESRRSLPGDVWAGHREVSR